MVSATTPTQRSSEQGEPSSPRLHRFPGVLRPEGNTPLYRPLLLAGRVSQADSSEEKGAIIAQAAAERGIVVSREPENFGPISSVAETLPEGSSRLAAEAMSPITEQPPSPTEQEEKGAAQREAKGELALQVEREIEETLGPKVADGTLSLEEGTVALRRLRLLLGDAHQRLDRSAIQRIETLVGQIEPLVAEKNFASTELTRRDLDMLHSGFVL